MNQSKKLVFVTNRFEVGGTENEIIRWSNSLDIRGFATEVWIIQNRIDNRLLALLPPSCQVKILTNYTSKLSYPITLFKANNNFLDSDNLYHITRIVW